MKKVLFTFVIFSLIAQQASGAALTRWVKGCFGSSSVEQQAFTRRPMTAQEVQEFDQSMQRTFAESDRIVQAMFKNIQSTQQEMTLYGEDIKAKAKAGVPGYHYKNTVNGATEEYGTPRLARSYNLYKIGYLVVMGGLLVYLGKKILS